MQFWNLGTKTRLNTFKFDSSVTACCITDKYLCGIDKKGSFKVFDYDGGKAMEEKFPEGSKSECCAHK